MKVKNLKAGDCILDRDGIKCLVEEIKEFDEHEMFILMREVKSKLMKLGSAPKETEVEKL